MEDIKAPEPFAKDQLDYRRLPIPDDIISTLNVKGEKVAEWLKPVEGKPLVFKTDNAASKEITLLPYYQVDNERYVIYWNLK